MGSLVGHPPLAVVSLQQRGVAGLHRQNCTSARLQFVFNKPPPCPPISTQLVRPGSNKTMDMSLLVVDVQKTTPVYPAVLSATDAESRLRLGVGEKCSFSEHMHFHA